MHVVDEQHEGAGNHTVEDLVSPFEQDHRCNRAELLAAFDVVHPLQVLRPARVDEQAAMPQRAGAVLASPVAPSDDSSGGEAFGGGPRKVGGTAVAKTGAPEYRFGLAFRPRSPQSCCPHRLDLVAEFVG